MLFGGHQRAIRYARIPTTRKSRPGALLLEPLEDRNLLATLIHDYPLNGSTTDLLGGPDLTLQGGMLVEVGYNFAADQGPAISDWTTGSGTAENYAIELMFDLDNTAGYKKLINFLGPGGSDDGLYDLETAVALIAQHTRHYAKRQLTWFRNEAPATPVSHTTQEALEQIITGYEKM